MNEKANALEERTKRFAVEILRLVRSLPARPECQVVGRQLARAAIGVAGNYHASNRSRSPKEFAARIAVAAEEADESVLWLEVVIESALLASADARRLVAEARELRAILAASARTSRARVSGREAHKSTNQ